VEGCIRLIRPRFAARIQLASFVDDSAKLIGPLETPPDTYSGGDIYIAADNPLPLLLILVPRSCNSIAQIPRCFSTTTHKHLDHAPSGLERMAAQVRMGQVGAVCTREVFRLRETVASGNNSLRSAE
jgi:hypothetical protein